MLGYTKADAYKAGFEKVVFIIRKSFEEDFREAVGDPVSKFMEVDYVFQEIDPEYAKIGRNKPFGTGEAIAICRGHVDGPFAVINADDYYGANAFIKIYDFLKNTNDDGKYHYAMVGYRIKNTVTEQGTVSRGVCQTENGSLKKVKETLKIKKYPDGSIADIADPENEVPLAPESPVSMNFWGFTPWIFEEMEDYFTAFLKGLSPDELKAECLLPVLVDKLITDTPPDIQWQQRLKAAGVDLNHDVRLSVAPRSELGQTCFLGENREVFCV